MQNFFIGLKAIAILSYLVLMYYVILSKAERRVRVLFSIYTIGMLFWQITSLMVSLAATPREALLWYNLAVAGTGTANVLFYPFANAFTKGKRRGILAVLAYVSCALMFVAGILGLTWREVVMGNGGYWVPIYNSRWLLVFGPIWYFFFGCGIIALLRGLFKEKSPERRNRILYVLAGASFVVIGMSTNLTPLRDYPVDISFNLISALTIGFAVIRYRLLDIRFVLVRSLYYSVMTALLIAAYIGLIFGFERLLQFGVGYSRSTYGIVAVMLLAFLFLPIRNMLQAFIDKVFFREKEDYQRETQRFSQAIASLYENETILSLVCNTVSNTIKTTFAAISLYDPATDRFVARESQGKEAQSLPVLGEDAQSPLARWLRKEGKPIVLEESLLDPGMRQLVEGGSSIFATKAAAVVVPVLLDQRLFGLIILGPKLSGLMFNAEDLSFVSTIANQTATALDKSEIFLKIRRQLSEQTLLFVLSEKFRGSSDFDLVMDSVVVVLKSFLNCDHCAIVYFDKAQHAQLYAEDRLSEVAAKLAARAWTESGVASCEKFFDGEALGRRIIDLAIERDDLNKSERELLGSLSYSALVDGDTLIGLIAMSDKRSTSTGYEPKDEFLRTIKAIISQGIILHRTIVDLSNLESYNEKILDSLNDMGDTLIILDEAGRIKMANKAICKLLDYREQELLGKPVSKIVAADGGLFSQEGFQDLMRSQPVSNRELAYLTSSGAKVPMLFSGSAMVGEDGKSREIIGIARDITERLKAEDAAKNLLLVQEVHHRIKNNLQVISSLLNLQASYVRDEEVKEMFRESQNRVRSMALIHEKLYRSESASSMDFAEYVRDLARNLMSSYSLSSTRVRLDVEVSDVMLDMDTAVPCSLIVNELVSNAFKHAFPGERRGRILVKMGLVGTVEAGESAADRRIYELVIEDDGVGFPVDMDPETSPSLGLRIVATLGKQLHGAVTMTSKGGTRFVLRFMSRS